MSQRKGTIRAFGNGEEQLLFSFGETSEGVEPLLNMQAVFRWRLTKAVLHRRGLIESCFTRAPGPELDRYDWAEVDKLLARMADLDSFGGAPA